MVVVVGGLVGGLCSIRIRWGRFFRLSSTFSVPSTPSASSAVSVSFDAGSCSGGYIGYICRLTDVRYEV